jgi:hypothetical protein
MSPSLPMSGTTLYQIRYSQTVVKRYQGDQDYIGAVIDHNQRRHFEQSNCKVGVGKSAKVVMILRDANLKSPAHPL